MTYPDGVIRGIHRSATTSQVLWPAHVVAVLAEEIIRLRGTDTVWLLLHPSPQKSSDD